MTDYSDKLAAIMPQVAELVLNEEVGPKNKGLSDANEWRWGAKGSISVRPRDGIWKDHEDGLGGGTLDLLRAFKGIEGREAFEWLEKAGLWQPEPKLANGAANGNGAHHPAGEKFAGFMEHWPVATFKYYDREGKFAYEILKFSKDAPRRYMSRRPHPTNPKEWIWKLKAGRYGQARKGGDWFAVKPEKKYRAEADFPEQERFLYHHAEVQAAKKAGKYIVLVGGEKDTDTLREWGFCATTNAGGEQYWSGAFDDDLAGADIIICSDNDAVGRQRTLMRGAALKPKAKSVRVLDLARHWPEIGEKDDVSDWKEKAGGTADRFAELCRQARPWQPEAPPSRFNAVEWEHLDDPGPELEFLIDGWLTEGERSVIGGPSRSGKSFLAIHVAMCIARGVDFFQYKVTKPGGVIYQAGEGVRGIRRRLKAYRQHFGVSTSDRVPFVLLQSKVDLYSRDGDTLALADECRAWSVRMPMPLRLIVIDTLATATAGADENSGKDMGTVLSNIAKISEATGAHVMLVHHMNADGKKLRGHTSVGANVDQIILVTHDEDTNMRKAVLFKQKDDEDGLVINFALDPITLGVDDQTGRDIRSCVVLSVSEKEQIKREQARMGIPVGPTERRILGILFEALDRHGAIANGDEPNMPRHAVGKMCVPWPCYRDIAIERTPEIDDREKALDRITKEFSRSKDGLIKLGILGLAKPYMWWAGKPVRGFPKTFPDGQQPDFTGRVEQGPEQRRLFDEDEVFPI